MKKHHVVFDLVTVFHNLLPEAIRRCQQFCSAAEIAGKQVTAIVRSGDSALVQATFGDVATVIEVQSHQGERPSDSLVMERVRDEFTRLQSFGTPTNVQLVSYRGSVMKIARALYLPNLDVTVVHFDRLDVTTAPVPIESGATSFAVSPNGEPRRPWRYGHLVTESEALSVFLRALNQRRAVSIETAVRLAGIRELMSMFDSRFIANARMTRTQGLLASLVAIASAQGLIRAQSPDSRSQINPLVWLVEDSPGLQAILSASDGPMQNSIQDSANGATEDVCRSDIASVSPIIEEVAENAKPIPEEVESDVPSLELADGSKTSAADLSPSEEIKQSLASIKLGPYPVARVALYEAIDEELGRKPEKPVTGSNKHSLRSLIRAAIVRAPAVLAQQGLDPSRQRGVWKHAARLVKKLVLDAEVLVGPNGIPIRNGLGTDLVEITGVLGDWRSRADARIILAYVEHTGDFPENRVEDLAGVLFASRDDDRYGATVASMRHLLDTHRLVPVDDGGDVSYQIPESDVLRQTVKLAAAEVAQDVDDFAGKIQAGPKPR